MNLRPSRRAGMLYLSSLPYPQSWTLPIMVISSAQVSALATDCGGWKLHLEVKGDSWAVSSVVEHFVHTEGVVGSNPIPPTNSQRWSLYILRSEKTARYYVGHTNDLDRRVREHNSGQTKSTRPGRPWVLVYVEEFDSKRLASEREREIKSWKSRRTIEERLLKIR